MKVLYAAYRHDPLTPGGEVGADYQFLKALEAHGMDLQIVGPFTKPAYPLERMFKRFYTYVSGSRYLKYDLTNSWRASQAVSRAAQEWQPDVVFSLYPAPLAFYSGRFPCVFRTDATFIGAYSQSPEFVSYGNVALKLNIWLEYKAILKCIRVITHSEWARQSLINDYHLAPQRIVMFPSSTSLPAECIPEMIDLRAEKNLGAPLRLLFIGRDAHRKGLDIALEVVAGLNRSKLTSSLTICGLDGVNNEVVTYAGNLNKSHELQRSHYLELLRSAHFLLHPARFDPSPRVVAEAAAFGTPVITNNSGGLATTVKHKESGIVLPRNSPAESYIETIRQLICDPESYYALCQSTHKYYKNELSSTVTGQRLAKTLLDAVNSSS